MQRHRWDLQSPREPRPVLPINRATAAARSGASRPALDRYVAPIHGRYVPVDAADTVEQRILNHAARLSPGQAVTGWAALRLWGVGLCDGLLTDGTSLAPVPLAAGPKGGTRHGEGAVVFRDRLPADDVVDLAGVPLVTVERATFDAMRATRDLRRAVIALDMSLGSGVLTLDGFGDWVARRTGWHGVKLVRAALPLARPFTRSPQETRLRLVAELDLGIAGLLVNHSAVGLHGGGPGEVDLLDADAGMVLEYDGADHRTPERQTRDLAKEDGCRDVDLVLARFTAADLRNTALVCRRILATRARARFLPETDRTWFVRLPPPRTNEVFEERSGRIRA